jgi:Tfp pilus assembly protein FimT
MTISETYAAPATAGFSMIELLTILVIVGVLASVALPSMGEFIARTQTQKALDQLVADVSYARMMAVERGRRAAVRLHAGGVYTVETLNDDGTWSPVRRVELQKNYADVEFAGGATSLEFSSRGLITNLAADSHLKLRRGSVRDSAYVSPAGRVYRDF